MTDLLDFYHQILELSFQTLPDFDQSVYICRHVAFCLQFLENLAVCLQLEWFVAKEFAPGIAFVCCYLLFV
jgi:hypothetical protein